jgi:hypothetical protein
MPQLLPLINKSSVRLIAHLRLGNATDDAEQLSERARFPPRRLALYIQVKIFVFNQFDAWGVTFLLASEFWLAGSHVMRNNGLGQVLSFFNKSYMKCCSLASILVTSMSCATEGTDSTSLQT